MGLFSMPTPGNLLAEGFPASSMDNLAWTLEKEKGSVRVYSADWPDNNVLAFKAEALIETSISSLLAMMVDIDNYVNWIVGCKGSKTLIKISDWEYIGHVVIDAGVVFRDRDFVVHAKGHPSPGTGGVTVQYSSLEGYLERLDRTIRVLVNEGSWTLTPADHDKVRLVWQGRLDPGGWFPTWLLKMLFDTVVLKTMEDIIREVKDMRYQNIVFKGFKYSTDGPSYFDFKSLR